MTKDKVIKADCFLDTDLNCMELYIPNTYTPIINKKKKCCKSYKKKGKSHCKRCPKL